MRREWADLAAEKGWYLGAWTSDLQLSVSWATAGIDLPHHHECMTEIFLVARDTITARVEGATPALRAGGLLALALSGAQTFPDSSDDSRHLVIHTPAPLHGAAQADHAGVARDRLGL